MMRRWLPSRRNVIAGAAALTAVNAHAKTLGRGSFSHGVASGDPLPQAVIIWTRFVPADGMPATIAWEMAEDQGFRKIVRKGLAQAEPFNDWCVKVDTRPLPAGTRFYFRFLSADGASIVGETLTAPASGGKAMKFAIFSCANKRLGYFHAYAHAAADPQIDLCIHTGDYFYTYASGQSPSDKDAVPGREIEPKGETFSLTGYRARYASYRDDPDLQELHRVKPFSSVWDDHEFARDAGWDQSPGHNPQTQGDWFRRRAEAAKAYDDWMPHRRSESVVNIFRKLQWGSLATFLMLDTRLYGRRDAPLEDDFLWPIAMAGRLDDFVKAARQFQERHVKRPERSMLGQEQERWLAQELLASRKSGTTWQVLAQGVVMNNIITPPEAPAMVPATAGASGRAWINGGAALGQYGISVELDAWADFPAARERLLDDCRKAGANALVLSGDSHSAWAANLGVATDGKPAALEMATTSVTSIGREIVLGNAKPGEREAAFLRANPQLAYCDLTSRGYVAATLTPQDVTADWVALADIKAPARPTVTITRTKAAAGNGNGPGPWHRMTSK